MAKSIALSKLQTKVKIQILSDLHIEFQPFRLLETDADVIILAGDIHVGEKGLKWAIANISNKPVIYVLGNHEYYGHAYPKLVQKLKNYALGTNVHVLENDGVAIAGVQFFGCTLWTDFQLFGNPRLAGYEATQRMTDFRRIRVSPNYSKFKSIDAAIAHKKSVHWLQANLANHETEKLVVVTHHAPSQKSVPLEYQADIVSAAYASHLDDLVASSDVGLWIHGHTHHSWDYKIDSTRIVCNPRGYPDEPNHFFDPKLVIEI
jgi:predicted phosphodiesterase